MAIKYCQYFFVLVLIWPILLSRSIDRGIGNTFKPIIIQYFLAILSSNFEEYSTDKLLTLVQMNTGH